MKKDIHPNYEDCTVTCGCGNTWVTRSTVSEMKIEICSNCHPFYTGAERVVDSMGRVDRFQKKFGTDYFASKATKRKAKQTRA